MARPKEKLPPLKTKTLTDRCNHEKEILKQGVIKQLQRDLEGLLDSEIHSDLTIRAEGIEINIHKFILRSRSQAIYERLTKLSIGDDSSILIMPPWLPHQTVLFIVRKLYFVETSPLDEGVDRQDEVLMDYLKSLLMQYDNSIKGSKEKDSKKQNGHISSGNGCSNGEIIDVLDDSNGTSLLNGLCGKEESSQDGAKSVSKSEKDNVFMVVNNSTVDPQSQDINPLDGVSTEENLSELQNTTESEYSTEQTSECDNNKGDSKNDNSESNYDTGVSNDGIGEISYDNGESKNDNCESKNENGETKNDNGDNSDKTDLDQIQCSFSDIIKLSYGLSVPYEACNRVGEDLLKGYLQEIDTDCEIVVSDVHFKAHKCVLCARSTYFNAMLGGSWRETDTVHLESVTPNVIEQMLLYLYGGVVDIISCTVDELIMSADMYGLQGVNEVVISFLKREYCHMFHKICTGCEERLPEALSIAITFHIDQLRDKCVEWVNRNMLRMWRSKYLAKQPQDVLDYCYTKAVQDLNRETAIDLLMKCENLNHNIPRISWSEPLLCNITKVQDSVIEYISRNFICIINSDSFDNLDKGLGYRISLLEEIFVQVIKSLPINKACEVYRCLALKQSVIKALEINEPSEDFIKFINFLVEKCESFLKRHVHQVVNTEGWKMLSKDTQSKLLEGGSFVLLNNPNSDSKGSKAMPTGKERSDARKVYKPANLIRKPNKNVTKPKTQQKPATGESGLKTPKMERNAIAAENMSVANSADREDTSNLAASRVQDTLYSNMADEYDGTKTEPAVSSSVKNDEHEQPEDTTHAEGAVEIQEVVLADLPEAIDFVVQLIPILQFTFHTPI